MSRLASWSVILPLALALGCGEDEVGEVIPADQESESGGADGTAEASGPGLQQDRPGVLDDLLSAPPAARVSHPIEQFADARILGNNETVRVGSGVAATSDLNGDGLPDLLTSSRDLTADQAEGGVWAFESPVLGITSIDTAVGVLWAGPGGSAGFDPSAFTGIGDADGDGFGEVVAAAPWGGSFSDTRPALALFEGPIHGALGADDATTVIIDDSFDADNGRGGFAHSIASAGDLNGDGLEDLLAGNKYFASSWAGDDAGAGAVWVFLSPLSEVTSTNDAQAVLLGTDSDNYTGDSVAGAGDVDGDGLDDIVVGAPRASNQASADQAGRVYVITSGVQSTIDIGHADAVIRATESHTFLGSSVDGAGDVNDDGYDDIIIGGSAIQRDGGAFLMSGPISGQLDTDDAVAVFQAGPSDEQLGRAVAGAGDANGDGFDDVMISAYKSAAARPGGGAVGLYTGPLEGTIAPAHAELRVHGSASLDWVGSSLDGGRDLDGDGLDDLLIGAYIHDNGELGRSGATYIIYGVDGGW
jgi:hypothetical protein